MASNCTLPGSTKKTANRQASDPKRDFVSAMVIVGLALLAWEGSVRLSHTPPYILPPPSTIAGKLWENAVYLGAAAWVTLGEALGGLILGLSVGIAIAALITFWTNLERGILALAILVKATPMVAIAPLFTIWFGFGALPKVLITALLTFFPVLINVHSGLYAVDETMLALFHSLHAGRWEVFRYARWPTALPYLFAALKVVAPLAVTGAVVAEWVGASAGLGRAMWLAYSDLKLPMLFAAVFCSALMSIGLYGVVLILEKRVVFWRRAAQLPAV